MGYHFVHCRLDRAARRVGHMYWDVKRTSEAEARYEQETQKIEADLRKQQASIDSEIQALVDKAGTVPSQDQYGWLASRLKQLSSAIDELSDAEIKAPVKYTSSGPGSRAQ